ncbi:hypothetical protein MKW98_007795 [Papaver atlanticum]|uniref:Uncharacterized protein n=1 Tax=Papaver atlanticum TaxID=357466 RepID=A0AAD4RXS3_9MAGN|nr:hypothetical protein MKW98_007795 [Papaver atlanticum]
MGSNAFQAYKKTSHIQSGKSICSQGEEKLTFVAQYNIQGSWLNSTLKFVLPLIHPPMQLLKSQVPASDQVILLQGDEHKNVSTFLVQTSATNLS